jgi:hypothetical protein
VTGKVHALHLRADRALDGEVALVGAEQLDLVAAHVERREERHGVDVVPVRVRDEDARREALAPRRMIRSESRLMPEPQSKMVERLAADLDADAGRVAAVARVGRAGRRQRAVHAPVVHHHAFETIS